MWWCSKDDGYVAVSSDSSKEECFVEERLEWHLVNNCNNNNNSNVAFIQQ